MMKPTLISLTFVAVFLIIQLLGMYVGLMYFQAVQAGVLEPAMANPDNPANSLMLFLYILVGTGAVILILRFRRSLLGLLEVFILFTASWITLDFLAPVSIGYVDAGLILAIILTAWRILRPDTLNYMLALIFSLSGVGALLGASLGVSPAMIFILLVSIYDFVSVFLTKHMVYMAKSLVAKPTIFTLSVPSGASLRQPPRGRRSVRKVRVFNLGSGDIALPLVFVVSLLTNFGPKYALFSLAGVTVVLLWLLNWRVKATMDKPSALPAMPFLTVGLVVGFLLSVLF